MKLKIGNRLLTAREERKLSQVDMAEILGVSQSVYSRLERNESSADLEQLVNFSKTLQIPIQDFLPEILSFNSNNQNNHNGQGLVLGNVYYYADKSLEQENAFLKEKNALLEREIQNLQEINALLKTKNG